MAPTTPGGRRRDPRATRWRLALALGVASTSARAEHAVGQGVSGSIADPVEDLAETAEIPDAAAEGWRSARARDELFVHWYAQRTWPRRALVQAGAILEVGALVQGPGCSTGWLEVAGGGFVCSYEIEPSSEPARMLPVLPDPPDGRVVPFLYAHDLAEPAFNCAYVARERDDDGTEVLVRPDGERVEAAGLTLHEPSTFQGRDLRDDPVPAGSLPAWSVLDEAPIHARATTVDPPIETLPRHTAVIVDATPVDPQGRWYRVRGPGGVRGFVDERTAFRHWVPAPAPEDLDPDALWIDVELSQQVLAVRRGEQVLYVTLVSAGLPERPTPPGLYRIIDKRAHSSMVSLPSSEDPYLVEEVPWTMYFRPHYALHGAYWHDEFGRARSHGCVNLAPRDAAWIYERVAPRHAPGFTRTYDTPNDPGTVVRIRDGAQPVPDLREDPR